MFLIALTLSSSLFIIDIVASNDKSHSANLHNDLKYDDVNIEQEKEHLAPLFELFSENESFGIQLQLTDNDIKSFEKDLISDYVPQSADVTEVLYWDNHGFHMISIDYQINDTRYFVMYFLDGTVHKAASDQSLILSNKNNEEFSSFDFETDLMTVTRTEDELKEIRKSFETNNFTAVEQLEDNYLKKINNRIISSIHSSYDTGLLSSTIDVLPGDPGTLLDDSLAKSVYSSNTFYLSSLANRGFYPYTASRVFETQRNHLEYERAFSFFNVGTSLSYLTLFWNASPNSIGFWLNLASVSLDAYQSITQPINAIQSIKYNFHGGTVATVRDTSEYNAHVKAFEIWDWNGLIGVTWDYNGQYNNPTWGHQAQSHALSFNNHTAYINARNYYSAIIDRFGVWNEGLGNWDSPN